MAYCVKTDLDTRAHPDNVIRWADDDNDGSLSAGELATVDEMIDRAEDIIDTKLSARYSVPFSSTPGIIKRICVDLAVYALATRRGFAAEGGGEAGLWQRNFDEATGILDALAAGQLSIPGVAPQTSIHSTEKDVQAALTYTKQDESGEEIETDLDNTLDDYVEP
ncbi:MAG: DUF1320 domain-containing protein [Planctomycetes bacterium]|nr:DUF1320 domain-containing protein [Planctomycetota bacterium]